MENRKSTGIVRRIDDLGRLVIPKEIRRTLHICEGDPMEIFVTEDTVSFKKYSVLGQLSECGDVLRGLYRQNKSPILLCDRDKVIAACGIPKEQYEDKAFSENFSAWIGSQRHSKINNAERIKVFKDNEWYAEMTQPIRNYGEFYGTIVMLTKETDPPSEVPFENRKICMELAVRVIESMIEMD